MQTTPTTNHLLRTVAYEAHVKHTDCRELIRAPAMTSFLCKDFQGLETKTQKFKE